MFIHILLAIGVGILLGTFTGLTPGIHINLVSVIILSISPWLLQFVSPIILVSLIISMAIVHTFLDNVPSIFLGAPTEDTALSVLPGHRFLLKGRGYEAVMLMVLGSFSGLILSVIFTPALLVIFPWAYELIKSYTGYILLAAMFFLIIREKNKINSIILFFLSGILGVLTLNIGIDNVLFPLLSGLFGLSTLILSIKDKTKIPKQEITFPKINKKEGAKTTIVSFIVGAICSFMPGIGPAQGAVLGSQFIKKISQQGFLILVGGLSTVNMVLSLITLYKLEKARNGAVAVALEIIETVTQNQFLILIAVTLIVSFAAVFLCIKLSKIFSNLISKVNYQKLCISIILFIIILTIILSGIMGLFVLILATFIGIIPSLTNTPKSHLMGCLILPVLFYFL
ncbi:MAG: tripartite tricarboxylate transporter permease [Candidatus Nanoarchaeia archaeon]|nr:tripartite tricarboxylate transporter permease [Candidatus Nanoarchaeia archaeon]